MVVVSSGGIFAHPAAEPAGRGRLHPVNPDPPGANHHITGSLNTPRSLCSATDPEPTLCASETPRSPRLRVSHETPRLRVSESGARVRESGARVSKRGVLRNRGAAAGGSPSPPGRPWPPSAPPPPPTACRRRRG